ncbi:hypothetical protein [Paraburkholderia tropica]|uniref:hypothetical protein n=1 Tax=Paraburkholderia tropica TaxID=92647 RepID=UPI002AB68BDB|nr:hypothetical protein [Paraburkholderia tropica]
MFKNFLMFCAAVAATSSAHAQIPVVGGPVDEAGAILAQRCIDAGVSRENVSLRACVEDARQRAREIGGSSALNQKYYSELSLVPVAVPVVAKDSRAFMESASGRFPVSGGLVMRAGITCAFQEYAIAKSYVKEPMLERRIASKQGVYVCNGDGSPVLPPL